MAKPWTSGERDKLYSSTSRLGFPRWWIWVFRFFRLARRASACRWRRSSALVSCREGVFGEAFCCLSALFSSMFPLWSGSITGIMVRAGKNFVKGCLHGQKPYGIVRAFALGVHSSSPSNTPSTPRIICRRSSGVERAIGNGEVDSSILSGGTIFIVSIG